MSEFKKYKRLQNMIFLILWAFIFTFPVILSIGGSRPAVVRVAHESVKIFPFFILFLVNNFVFFKLFERKKYAEYTFALVLLILGISLLSTFKLFALEMMHLPPPPMGMPQGPGPGGMNNNTVLTDFFYSLIFSVLVIGLNNSIRITFNWIADKKEYEELQKENLKTELAYLQHQINPHFFMNTLNNIHSLIEFDKEKAKDSVIKLSKLMRVLLYENEKEKHTLEKEIAFAGDYIDLMRIRTKEDTDIKFEYPNSETGIKIEPFLFINFIENAFKHGIRAAGNSFIHIKFSLDDNMLCFEIKNSKKDPVPEKKAEGSVGMGNSIKRLDILYKDSYTFDKTETDNEFSVKIKIPVKK